MNSSLLSKNFNRGFLILFITAIFSSCTEPEDEAVTPLVLPDISGDYEGVLTVDVVRGYVMYSMVKKSGDIYTLHYEGSPIAEAQLQPGNIFVSTTQFSNSGFTTFSGQVSENLNAMNLQGTGKQGESVAFDGDRNETGLRIPTDLTLDGQEYAYWRGSSGSPDCDDSFGFTFGMFPSYMPNKNIGNMLYFDLDFDVVPGPGSYSATEGAPSSNSVNARVSYYDSSSVATSGFVIVSGDGSKSGVSVQVDNLVFDKNAISKEPITPFFIQGSIECRN